MDRLGHGRPLWTHFSAVHLDRFRDGQILLVVSIGGVEKREELTRHFTWCGPVIFGRITSFLVVGGLLWAVIDFKACPAGVRTLSPLSRLAEGRSVSSSVFPLVCF